MSDNFQDRKVEFNKVVEDAKILLSIARDSDLQQAEVNGLGEMLMILGDWKREAVENCHEDRANLVLGMECIVAVLTAELKMWLLLKAHKPEAAWGSLVDSQTAMTNAMRAHKEFSHLEDYAKRLDEIERLLFPAQVFLSAGMIVGRQICTICNTDYEGCPHIVGMPYCGEFCFRRFEDITMDHVSIVDDPANKRCRVTHFNDEGGKRNRMTWRIEPIV